MRPRSKSLIRGCVTLQCCAAYQGIGYQRAVFVVHIAHTRFLGGGGGWGIGDCVQGRGFEDALGLAVVGVVAQAVV